MLSIGDTESCDIVILTFFYILRLALNKIIKARVKKIWDAHHRLKRKHQEQ